MNEDIVTRIKQLIGHYELTVSSFADKIGVQRSSISHLLSGRNRPSLDFVLKVVQQYPEVNLYWLLNGKGTFPAEKETANSPTLDFPQEISKEKLEKDEVVSNFKSMSKKLEPVKIVIFYSDGTFESFGAKKQ